MVLTFLLLLLLLLFLFIFLLLPLLLLLAPIQPALLLFKNFSGQFLC
jgi:hypothetical protein